MKEVQKQAMEKAITWLIAAGCKFAIIDPDGNKHGTLDVTEKNGKKRPSIYPHGELSSYVAGYLTGIEVGAVAEVPLGKYERRSIVSSCSSWMCRYFGNGTHTASFNKKNNSVEVLRIS